MTAGFPPDDPAVPNAPIRAAFEASGLTITEVAMRVYPGAKPTTRAARALGIRPERTGRYQKAMRTSVAKRFLEAMDLAPVDVGL
jgi:hypothetical protein